MFGLDTIKRMNKVSARQSAKEKSVPKVFSSDEAEGIKNGDSEPIRSVPNLGDRCPKGWRRVNIKKEGLPTYKMYEGDNNGFGAYLIDGSGFDSSNEPAMTIEELLDTVYKVWRSGEYGLAICEAGQFQVKIGVYKKA